MILKILTEANAATFLYWVIGLLGGALVFVVGWLVTRLINNLDQLNKTVSTNNIYQQQHFEMLKSHDKRILNLEHRGNGTAE